ncbi:hypothetical protein ID866_12358 [Astraeus odoratus]|nr:hypothetical protein ID866_12358 [Astraeus odoratus]
MPVILPPCVACIVSVTASCGRC